MPRIELQSDKNFYIATNGDDTNDGMTLCTPWKTAQHAWDVFFKNYDFAGYTATVNIAKGNYTYAVGVNATGSILGSKGPSSLVFKGDPGSGNTLLQPSLGNCFAASCGAMLTIRDMALDTTIANQDEIAVGQGGQVHIDNLIFNQAGHWPNPTNACNHMSVGGGGYLQVNGNYIIAGGAQCHLMTGNLGNVYYNTNGATGLIAVTVLGQPTFYAAFMCSVGGFTNVAGIGWNCPNGASHGLTYLVKANGTIYTENGNVNYFPGDIAGVAQSGGIYV